MVVMNSVVKAIQKYRYEAPTAIPILLLALATITVFIAPLQLLLALLTIEFIYLIHMDGVKKFLQTAIPPMAVFIAPFLLLSAAIQIVVNSGIDVSILMLFMARVMLLYLSTILSIRMLSIGKLMRDLSKLSPVMALSIAIGIRMFTIGLHTLNEVKAIYSVNIGTKCSRFRCRVEYITLLAKAITRIFIYTVLNVGESIYSRYSRMWMAKQKPYNSHT